MVIYNATQHPATPEQIAQGVRDFKGDALEKLKSLLTFETLPTREEIEKRATSVAQLVWEEASSQTEQVAAMIGGAPYLMSALERALIERGITPLYAFSTRETVEETLPDGSVKKTNIFRHTGFVQVTE